MNPPTTFNITLEQLQEIRVQLREHYFGTGLPGGVQTLESIRDQQRRIIEEFRTRVEVNIILEDAAFQDIVPQLLHNQINIAYNLRRVTTDFMLWITLYLFEKTLIESAEMLRIEIPHIQEWDMDVDNARANNGYIQFLADNLNNLEILLIITNDLTKQLTATNKLKPTAQQIIEIMVAIGILHGNAVVRFQDLRHESILLTGDHVNYNDALIYFDRMKENQNIHQLFLQAVNEYIGAIRGQPLPRQIRNKAKLRQALQNTLTDVDDAPSRINRCVTCDPLLCCGDCCLTCCNPTIIAIWNLFRGIFAIIGGNCRNNSNNPKNTTDIRMDNRSNIRRKK